MSHNETHGNLMSAFAGESQANRKYTAFARKAEAEGKLNAARLFRAAADAETIHALREFELAGNVGSTADNLKAAQAGETYEYTEMYPAFLDTAVSEGIKGAQTVFTHAMKAEEVHARLYQDALNNLDTNAEITYYLCPVCGNIETVRPGKCPICQADGSKFIQY